MIYVFFLSLGDDGFGDPPAMDDDTNPSELRGGTSGVHGHDTFRSDSLFDAGETPRPSTSEVVRGGKTPLYSKTAVSERTLEAEAADNLLAGGDDGFGGNIGSGDILSGGLFEGGGLFEEPALDITAQTPHSMAGKSGPGSRKVNK